MGEEVEDITARLRDAATALAGDLTFGLQSDVSVMREAADTIESLRASLTRVEEEVAHVRTMMILSWPPPLNQSMPEGTLPQQFRAYMDAEIYARRDEECRFRAEVLDAIDSMEEGWRGTKLAALHARLSRADGQ